MNKTKKMLSSKMFNNIVAVITALSLVFLQVPITNLSRQAMADATEAVQEQLAETTSVDVPLSFENAYITYAGQILAPPASMVTIPTGSGMEFTASADSGYQLESVTAVINGSEIELSPDGSGVYRLTESDVVVTSNITVRAFSAPVVEEVVAEEPEDSEATDEATEAVDDEQGEESVSSDEEAADARTEFTYTDDAVTVVATLSEAGAVPANAEFQVKPITASTSGYNYDVYMEALNANTADVEYTADNTLLYDVAFMVPKTDDKGEVIEGEFVEYEPEAGTVAISITFKKDQLADVLDGEQGNGVEVIHLPLSDSVRDGVDSTEDATNIYVSDVAVETVAGASGSVSDEMVSFTLSSLSVVGISTASSSKSGTIAAGTSSSISLQAVAKGTPTSTNLADFLTGVTFNAPKNDEGKYVVTNGASYTFTLAFAENQSLQFPDDGSTMYYQLPEGLDAANGQQGTLNIKVNDGGTMYTVSGNQYWIENGVLYFKFNTSDPHYNVLTAASNAKLNMTFSGTVDESAANLTFKDGITKDLEVDTSNSVSVTKTAWPDKANNKVHYTVSVVSKGLSKNVNVKDTLSGTGLTLDASSIKATSSRGGSVSMSGGANGNSFDYTIAQMKDGEVVTFTYDANVDPSQIPLQDGKYVTTGTNQVSVKSDGDPTPHTVTRNTTIDYTPTVNKSNATISSESNGKKVLDWTITANSDAKVSMAGSKITDTINDQSKSIMKYTGSGIKVDVYDASGKKVETRNVSWSQLTDKSDYSWTYTVPDSDKGKAYKYVITYQTEADVSTRTGTIDLGNNVSTDGGKSSGGGIQVIGTGGNGGNTGGGNTGGGSNTPNVTIAKSVDNIDLENMEITWRVIFNVPSSGLSSAVVTDTAPNRWVGEDPNKKVTIDFIKEGSVTVEGLKSGESYSIDYAYPQNSWETINTAKITFYQDQAKAVPGLQSGDDRTITVTMKTEINEDWLNQYEQTGNTWDQQHTNTVNLQADGAYVQASATAEVIKADVTKTAKQVGTRNVNGTELPVYKYTLVLANVTSDVNVIEDAYDTSLLEPYEGPVNDDTWFSWRLTNFTNNVRLDQTVPYVVTDNGIRFTTTPDCMPHDSNSSTGYYAQYKLSYYLTVKDEAAMQTVIDRAAESEDGVYAIGNSAEWDGNTDEAEVTYEYQGLKKEILTPDNELTKTDEDIWADFRITLNPGGAMLNGGEPMTMTDTYENLSIDFASITATPSEGVTWDASGNVVTYKIPDQTKVVITYRARVVFDDNGSAGETKHIAFSNVAEMNGYRGEVNKTAQRTNSGAGSASVNAIYLLKYEAGNMTNRLQGATFALLDADKNPVKDKWGDAVTFTTPEDGRIEIRGDQDEYGWSIQENQRYYLRELVAPEGYSLAGFDYSFQVSEDGTTDYSQYIYHNGDTMTAKNYKGTDVQVAKEWSDGNQKHANDAVTVKLQQKIGDGSWSDAIREEVKNDSGEWVWQDTASKTVTLNAANSWSAMFSALPVEVPASISPLSSDDVAVEYRVVETAVNGKAPEAGTVTVISNEGAYNSFTITNKVEEKVSVPVQKVWVDANNQDGIQPKEVTVKLLADGKETGKTAKLNADNGWKYTFEDLDQRTDSGTVITYTVDEDVPAGYVNSITGSAQDGFTITNTHVPEKTGVSAKKVWSDADNQDGTRPETVQLRLLANGVDAGRDVVTLSESNGWADSWTDLPTYSGGKAIEYTIQEVNIPDGYKVSYDTDGATLVATNTHTPEKTSVSVEKEWSDKNDQDGMRADKVTVNLLADGKKVDSVELSASNNWKHTFSDLAKNANGKEINYTVEEESVPEGYEAKVDGSATAGYKIVNTHTPNKTGIMVKKVWNDSDNRDGARPESITVQLKANGENSGEPVTLSADNNWTYQWTGLDMNAGGKAIAYTVNEVAETAGYTTVITGDMHNGFVVTNSHENDVTSVSVNKEWADGENQDGIRPESVTVQLKADGVVQDTVTLNEGNSWTKTWNNLPKNKANAVGQAVNYTVEEVNVPAGYKATVSENTATDGKFSYTVTNTHDTEVTQITGTKEWDDAENQDGKRTESVQLQLNANGAPVKDAVTVNAGNNWQATWTDLPVYDHGNAIVYTFTEVAVPEDYTMEIGTSANGYTVTNSYAPGKKSVSVTKVWSDQDDFDGLRPNEITVQLKANGADKDEPVTLNADNGWTYTWSDLDQKAGGKDIAYTVEESGVPEGYTSKTNSSVTEDGTVAFTITNTHTPELTSASVTKVWEDADNQDGKRPGSIQVKLVRSDGEEFFQTLSEQNSWQYTWADLPTMVNGESVTYMVKEVSEVDGYEASTEEKDGAYTITNANTPEKTSAKVTKTWNDADDQDGKRAATVQLMANTGENGALVAVGDPVTVGKDDGWTYEWSDLDKYKNGSQITYSVVETAAEGYSVNVTRTSQDAFEYAIENSYTPEETSVAVVKAWSDSDDFDGLRPDSVQVQLYANNEATGDPVTLNEDNNWTYTWTGLDKNADGSAITYDVAETSVPGGYTMTKSGGSLEGGTFSYTITNTHTPQFTSASVAKVWSDADNQDGLRPESVQVQLYANGEAYGDAVELKDGSWSYEWAKLPTIIEGKSVVYTINEVDVPAEYAKVQKTETTEDGAYSFTITNSYTPETVSVPVTKVWNDENNQDGVRTSNITVRLLADGNDTGKMLTLNADNSWKGSFTNLAKKSGGTDIVYTVEEVAVPEGYEAVVTGDATVGFVVTNTHDVSKTSVQVEKVWQDNDNQDGVRPHDVSVQLYANGTAVGSPVSLDDRHGWSYTWDNLDKNADGEAIEYTVDEVEVPSGYEKVSVTGGAASDGSGSFSYIVTNAHDTEVTQITGTKEWDDANNQDGKRTDSVQLQLNANGEPVKDAVTVNADNNWKATWTDLPVYDHGNAIVYTVTEVAVPTDYTVEIGTAANDYTVTNSYAPGKTSVSVTKVWEDAKNQDGKRPGSIQVQLKADGVEQGEPVTLDSTNWTHTWNDLNKMSNGQEIVYTVEEVETVDGYTAVATGGKTEDGSFAYTITNTHQPELTKMSVAKAWEDNEDQDGIRPESISVTLLADGAEKATVQLDDSNKWSYLWTDLPVYKNGSKVTYTLQETSAAAGYQQTAKPLSSMVYVITNEHTPETVDIPVTKVWEDNDNQDGIRPDTVMVQLKADGQNVGEAAELNAGNEWKHVFEDLPKYKEGTEIVYSVEELQVDGYKTVISGSADKGFTVTNTHTSETTEKTVVKVWEDAMNQDGIRPASVTVKLHDDDGVVDEVVLDKDNNWTHTWKNLPVKRAGKELTYSVSENTVQSYTADIVDNEAGTFTVTNSYTPGTTSASVTKVWEDGDNRDRTRPESIQVQLKANGENYGDEVTLDAENQWYHAWTDLPEKADGQTITYTVEEVTELAAYETTVEHSGNDYTITNSYVPEVVSVSAKKIWKDDNNRDNIRPSSATLQLKADGEVVRTLQLNEENDWSATIADLPKNADGEAIAYTLGETDVPAGYEFSFSTGKGGVLVGTNTHAPETVSIPVTKTWSDANNQDGKRPSSITVNLMNGDAVVSSATLNESNDWSYTFENLPKLAAGESIDYTVQEVSVAGYDSAISGSIAAGFTVANTHTPETTSIAAVKVWNDENNQDGVRPESVEVQLRANGAVKETATLNAGNDWRVAWADLPVYENGVAITYDVVEADTPTGYESTVVESTADGVRTFTVTNTHTPETVSIPVAKVWDDDADRDSARPGSITVDLMDGDDVVTSVTLNESNKWASSFNNLPKYRNGTAIDYTVRESSVEGYTSEVEGSIAEGFTVTNTRDYATTSKTVRKDWSDDENRDGKRPDSIQVQLSNQGGAYGELVTLNADNNWTYTWDELPLNYAKGVQATYSVSEVTPEGYTAAYDTAEDGTFVITNSYTPDTTTASVVKVWKDEDDQDGDRPESIQVKLLADGEEQETVELNANNQWHHEWTGLLKNRNEGVAIEYTIEEVSVEGYTSEIKSDGNVFTITNTHTPETTEVEGHKDWSDNKNQDGLRTESVKLQLKADGVPVDEPVEVTADDWSCTWKDLPVYRDHGTEIVYTVAEVETPTGYTSTAGNADNGYTVTNKHTPEVIDIPVQKNWYDADDQDGMRVPVTVRLLADGTEVRHVELSDTNEWKHTFTELPKYRDAGTEIEYTVEEDEVSGYESDVTGDALAGFSVANTHEVEKTTVSVSKDWDDNDDQDGVRPESVEVQLYADGVAVLGTVTLSADNDWTYTWENLDKRAGGEAITYTVVEVELDDYTADVSGGEQDDGTFAYTVKNSYTPETTEVTGHKEWIDNDDQDGLRKDIESVSLQLYADGEPVGEPVAVTSEDEWSYTWTELEKYRDGGTLIAYTVEESEVSEGYSANVGDVSNGYTVTNTHVPVVTTATATKVWDDADNQDGKRAGSVTVQLMSNDGAYDNPVTLQAGNGWSYTWNNLPVYQNGEAVTYTVVETDVPDDYKAEVSGDVEAGFTVKNSYTPDVRNVSVVKKWNDENDQDGLRPSEIQVQLLADGEAKGEAVTLNEENHWSYTWSDLAKNRDAGTEIVYTIDEVSAPAGYSTEITGDAAAGFTVTNTHTPETTKVGVTKEWNDADNQDGVRPTGALLTLYADGVAVGSHSVVAGDSWEYEFTGLDKYRDGGTEIVYTVQEDEVDDNYEASIEGLVVTNTHETETVDVSGTKTWVDADNAAGDRPQSITVYLLADGKRVDETTASAANGWEYSFIGLDKYRDGGVEIVYTVSEEPVDGYTSSVDGYDLVNTRNAVVEFTASKTLDGRTLKPGEFSFELLQDDKVVQTIQNAGDGHARFDAIEYTPADLGSHSFIIREVPGGLNGVTYDETSYDITATVVSAKDGSLSVKYDGYNPETGAIFTNSYKPSGSVVLKASKALEGATLQEGAYTFQVIGPDGNVVTTAKNAADGSVTFPALMFSEAGTWHYTISEVVPADAKPLGSSWVADGIVYDTNKIGVTIEAVDNFEGELDFTVTYDGGQASFVNTKAADVTYPLSATKLIEGRDFKKGDEFTFTVEADDDDAPTPEKSTVTITPTSGSEATVDFGNITFTTADLDNSYTYTIREAGAGQDAVKGLTNDPFAHYVTLTVNDAGDGTMRVDATYQADADGIVFTNTYKATGEAVLQATKVLQGRELADNEFFFELTGESLAVPLHAHAAADGTVTFDPIAYTQKDAGKDFVYTISETRGKLGGVTYDTNSYDVTVHVEDKGDGTLDITYSYDEPPVFVNTYKAEATSVSLSAQKMLVGGVLQGGEFEFTLEGTSDNAAGVTQTATNDAQGVVAFDELNYEAAGVYEYRVFETVPADAVDNGDGTFTGADGIVYDGKEHTAVVTVTDNDRGELLAEVEYDGGTAAGISFGNTALARTGITFKKYSYGNVGAFDFSLTAVDASGEPRSGEAVDYSTALTIVDDGQAAFTATVQNGAYTGSVADVVFPEISFTQDGDYYYLVKENESSTRGMVADKAEYLVHVTVVDGDVANTTYNLWYEGEDLGETTDLSFYNNSMVTLGFNSLSAQSYTDEAQRVSVYPKAQKYLNGSTDQLVGGEFTFELIDGVSGEVIAVATNDETGKVAFFDEDTDPGLAYDETGEWDYYIREVAGDEAGMVYDDSTVLLTVTVDQGDEGLVATTTYNGPGGEEADEAGEAAFYNIKEGMDLTVQKVSRYGGEGLVDCTYALWMVGPNGDALVKEATSDENGFITFTDVTLLAGQKYYFKEVQAPKGHTVDPYRTAYFSLNEAGDGLVLVEETAADGWHSATENIEIDRAKGLVE